MDKAAPTEYANTRSYLGGLVTRKVIPEKHSQKPYLIRWHIKLPLGRAIYLHKLCMSDPDRDLHDHPWNFISILVRGTYREITPAGERQVRLFNVHKATDPHRVKLEKPVYTILLRGKRRREFGFHTEEGWMHWREYNKRFEGAEVI